MSADGIGSGQPSRQPPLCRLVDGEHNAVGGQQQDFVLTRVEESAHADLALAQRLFTSLTIADVVSDEDQPAIRPSIMSGALEQATCTWDPSLRKKDVLVPEESLPGHIDMLQRAFGSG